MLELAWMVAPCNKNDCTFLQFLKLGAEEVPTVRMQISQSARVGVPENLPSDGEALPPLWAQDFLWSYCLIHSGSYLRLGGQAGDSPCPRGN